MPTFAAARAGASLTPSPVTATASPRSSQDPDEPQLVLRRGTGDDGLAAQPLGELIVVERVERGAAVQDRGNVDPGVAGGRGNRLGVVATHDDRPHARVGEFGHGSAHPGAQRIAERRETDECKVRLGVGCINRNRGDTPLGHGDHP